MGDMLIPALFMGLFILAGGGLIYLGWYQRTGILRKCSVPVQAECIESRIGKKTSVIRYRAWVDGEERFFRDDQTAGTAYYAPKAGETVTLYIDPVSGKCVLPERARSISKGSFALGGCFVAAGILGILGILGVFG